MARAKNDYQEPRACTVELPKFRYLDDATRYLARVRDDVDETENLIRVQQKALAYLMKPKDSVVAALNKGTGTTIRKMVVPNVAKLEPKYGLAEELYDRYRTLEAVDAQVALQFPDRKGDAYARTVQQIGELKTKVRDQTRRVLAFLTEIAAEHAPDAFNHARQAVAQELENHVRFESSTQFLYASVDAQDALVFTAYTMLQGVHADDGRTVRALYVSLQWVDGTYYFVNVGQEFCPPDQLPRAKMRITTLPEVCGVLQTLLADEGFTSQLGSTLPPELK